MSHHDYLRNHSATNSKSAPTTIEISKLGNEIAEHAEESPSKRRGTEVSAKPGRMDRYHGIPLPQNEPRTIYEMRTGYESLLELYTHSELSEEHGPQGCSVEKDYQLRSKARSLAPYSARHALFPDSSSRGLSRASKNDGDGIAMHDFAVDGTQTQATMLLGRAATTASEKACSDRIINTYVGPSGSGTESSPFRSLPRAPLEIDTTNRKGRVLGDPHSATHSSYVPKGAPMTMFPRRDDVHSNPIRFDEMYDDDGFLIETQLDEELEEESLASTISRPEVGYGSYQSSVDVPRYLPESEASFEKSTVARRSTEYCRRNVQPKVNYFEGASIRPLHIQKRKAHDEVWCSRWMQRRKTVQEATASAKRGVMQRNPSHSSWNPNIVKQSAELAVTITGALKEHRKSINRGGSIRGIPRDLLEPYAAMMAEGWQCSNASWTPFSMARRKMIQSKNKKTRSSVVSKFAADKDLQPTRACELSKPARGVKNITIDRTHDDHNQQIVGSGLGPSSSLCSFDHVSRVASGQGTTNRRLRGHPDRSANERNSGKVQDGQKPSHWFFFGSIWHKIRVLPLENVPADQSEDVKE